MFETMIKKAEEVVNEQISNIQVLERKPIMGEITVTKKNPDCVDGFFCESPQKEQVVTGHEITLHPHQVDTNASYIEDRKALHERLEDNYISPIAMLPKQVFLKIVQKLELYPFKINDDAGSFNFYVKVDKSILWHMPKSAPRSFVKKEALKSFKKEYIQTVHELSRFDLAETEGRNALNRQKEYDPEDYSSRSIEAQMRAQAMAFRMPSIGGSSTGRYAVQFYRSKKDEMLDAVMGILADDINIEGKKRVDTFIVADESAIDIPSLYEDYKDAQEEKERDPIICASMGDAIAILYQYGDFPQEKKFMRIVRSLSVDDYAKYLNFKHKPWGLKPKVREVIEIENEPTKFGLWLNRIFG